MKINLLNLYNQQEKLDKEIQEKHDVSYSSTRNDRFLAFLVELGEFANATRCFKFWSYKPSESKERLLDEFADGLHFILSIGIDLNLKIEEIEAENVNDENKKTTDYILDTYSNFTNFINDISYENYYATFESFLKIIFSLSFNDSDVLNAYYLKLGINYKRQEENY